MNSTNALKKSSLNPYNNALPVTGNARWAEQKLLIICLFVVDILAIISGFLLAYAVRFLSGWEIFQTQDPRPEFYSTLLLWMLPLWIIIFISFKLYNLKLLFAGTEEYSRIFNACTMGMMFVIVAIFLNPELSIARAWLILSWIFVSACVIGGRWILRRIVQILRRKGRFLTAILIVGANEEGLAIAEQLIQSPESGAWVAGFVDDSLAVGSEILPGLKILGDSHSLPSVVRSNGVQELVIASNSQPREKTLEIFQEFANSEDVSIRLSSGLFEMITTGMKVQPIGAVPLLSVDKVRLNITETIAKTILDYSATIFGLIFLMPIMAIIGLLIRLDSPGPIIYRRRVLGMGGELFDAYKFRTMLVNADQILEENPELRKAFEENFKLVDDPRITRIGRILRALSLDELPQLFNVLRGEMSLVGPRMITAAEHKKYGKWGLNLLTVKPGLTGLWQISGRSDINYQERVKLDMSYIRNYSVWTDVFILLKTIPAVLKSKGAY